MLSSPVVFAVAVSLSAAAPTPTADSLTGRVRIAGTSFRRVVSLVVAGKPIRLTGSDAIAEITRLQSITIEVVGKNHGDRFEVATYRIIDIGGGAKPWVGTIARVGDGLALADGEGASIPLSLPPRNKRRLLGKVGAKAWVHGKKLVTGGIVVLQYGILRDPPAPDKAPAPQPQKDAPGP